ncbi:MAG: segregation/condensation protein A [Clostridia bacterium]|nr:segregation/condensation protein A [Clostridia bacterium]
MENENLDLGDFEGVIDKTSLEGMTQEDVSEVSEMVFYFENHEGPLDVLWRLVRSTKLDIKDIKIGDITGQYLEYVRSLNDLDMESMSWFIREAARLIEVKTNSLMPKPEADEDGEQIDMEELYKRRLEMYRLFKETSEELSVLENTDRFYKEPEKSANDFRIVLKNMNMQNLVDAFSKLLVRLEQKTAPIVERQVQKDRFTVRECFANIQAKLDEKKRVRFIDLFAVDFTKSEIINTFLALLELLKIQYASVVQDDLFGEIDIEKKEGEKIEDAELTEYN